MLKGFIPIHDKLDLVSFSEQRLSGFTSRILVTMTPKIVDNLSAVELGNNLSSELHVNDGAIAENKTELDKMNSLNQFRTKHFSTKKKE